VKVSRRATTCAFLSLAVACSAPTPAPAATPTGCAVTLPASAPRSDIGEKPLPADRFSWFGNDDFAVDLPNDGVYRVPRANTNLEAKVAWWRYASGNIDIVAERADQPIERVSARSSEGYGSTGFVPSAVMFSSDGCWRVTASLAGRQLVFVMFVRRAAENERAP